MTTPPTVQQAGSSAEVPPATVREHPIAGFNPRLARVGPPMQRPRLLWITSFGFGRLRPFPGTWGSIPPVLIAGAMIALSHGPGEAPWFWNAVCVAMLLFWSLACVMQGDRAEAYWRVKDPGSVTADESAGMAIALIALPVGWYPSFGMAVAWLLAAFVLFRLFDIFKPWPINPLQEISGGWGILLDDLAAGLATLIVLQGWALTQA